MNSYTIPLVPGPVAIPPQVLDAYNANYGSPDLEDSFFQLYARCELGLQSMLGTSNSVTIQSGEAMLVLWGALKSVLKPGDRVLAVGTGLFGYGFADMARQVGAEVEVVGFEYDQIADPQKVREAAHRFRPHLVSMVHCETPSGTLNPLHEIGTICREVDALYYVDFVASAGGTAVGVDTANIDLGLLGSQKVLSLMPDLAIVSVSQRAWEACRRVAYTGYDALQPWQSAVVDQYMPYTHNWQAVAGLEASLTLLQNEGLETVYQRHNEVAAYCRQRLQAMNIELFPADEAFSAPTVTAAHIPSGWAWEKLDRALREHKMVVGGNYGKLAGKVFRVGHMGNQARIELVQKGMDTLESILSRPQRAEQAL